MLLNPLLERLEDSVNKNNEILDALTQWVCCLFCSLQPQSNIQTVRCLFYCSVYIYWRISTIFGTMYRDIMQHKNYWFAHLPYIMLLNYFRKTYFLVFSVWNVHWRLFCPVRRLGFLVITGVCVTIVVNCAFLNVSLLLSFTLGINNRERYRNTVSLAELSTTSHTLLLLLV